MDYGLLLYLVSLVTMAGIYAVLALGLNIQWGYTGLLNIGIAGFFAIGAYTSAILTTPESPSYLGGFGLPVILGWIGAMLVAGLLAWPIGKIALRLRSDYLAICTIGIAEIIRLVLKNEDWLTNGTRGIDGLTRPFDSLLGSEGSQFAYLLIVLTIVAAIYFVMERSYHAPWGRMMRAIRENELAAAAMGKAIERRRLEAFVLGAMVMGLGGALMAHFFKFIGPGASDPLLATFLVWVMLILGGSGNNRGAILGALIIWSIWSLTEFITDTLPTDWAVRAKYIRVFLIGLSLQIILRYRPEGILPERPPKGIISEDEKTPPPLADRDRPQ